MYPPLKTLHRFSFALDAVQTCYQLTGPFTVWTTLTSLISFLATVILGFNHLDSFAISSTNLTVSPICTSIPPFSCAWQILGPTSLPSLPLVTLPRSSLWPIPVPRALWTADAIADTLHWKYLFICHYPAPKQAPTGWGPLLIYTVSYFALSWVP